MHGIKFHTLTFHESVEPEEEAEPLTADTLALSGVKQEIMKVPLSPEGMLAPISMIQLTLVILEA